MGEDVLSRFHNHCTPLYCGCVFSMPPTPTGAAHDEDATGPSIPTVLVTSRPPRHRVDYVDQLVGDDSAGQAPSSVMLEFGTDPSRAHGVDVIHLTDITTVIGDHRDPARVRMRRAKRFVKLLERRRIALVRTVYAPDAGRAVSRAEAIVNEAAASVIALSPSTMAEGHATLVIGHSHFRDRFLGYPREEATPGRLLITATDTMHPKYEATLKVFGVSDLPGWTLRIAGRVSPALEESYARTIADHTDTISLRNEALSDAARVSEISQAEVIVISAAETYEALSLLMLALSLDRPVLVEDTAQTRALADEIGPSWVRRHTGPLTAKTLETALVDLRTHPPMGGPNLDSRDPNLISGLYADVFKAAAAGR